MSFAPLRRWRALSSTTRHKFPGAMGHGALTSCVHARCWSSGVKRTGTTAMVPMEETQLFRSGLSDIGMHDGSGGRGWDLSHKLSLFHFRPNGAFEERTMPLADILQDLQLAASTSFLRKIRSTQIQKIICEGRTIFVTLGDFRAFIGADQVFLFGTQRPLMRDHASDLEWALRAKETRWTTKEIDEPETGGPTNDLPYEMRALETILAAVTDIHEARLGVLCPVIAGMLSKLETDGTIVVGIVQSAEREEVLLQKLLPLTKATETFRLAVHETRDALCQLMRCEYELAQMQLSWRGDHGKDQPTKDEAYFLSQRTRQVLATTERELAEIENEVFQLQHSIDTTREILQLNLARSRNRLQTLNLFTSIGAFSMGTGAFGAGLFGMNMEAEGLFNEGSEGLFYPVSGTLCGICMIMFGTCYHLYRKSVNLSIQRVQAESCVSAFAASLGGHDISYAFQQHFMSKRGMHVDLQNARTGSRRVQTRAQRDDPDSPVQCDPDENVPTVTKAEFASIIHSVTGVAPPKDHIDTVFELVDTDDSGSMNYQEYLAFFGSHSSQKGAFGGF